MDFAEFTTTGTLANANARSSLFYNNRIASTWWDGTSITVSLSAGLQRVTPTSRDLRRPQQRILQAIGSMTNPSVMLLLDTSVNMIKGFLIAANAPLTVEN